MSLKRKTHVMSWVLGALLAAGTALRAESGEKMGPGGDGEMREEHAERTHKELGLSEEQAKKLKDHREAHRQAAKVLWEDLRTKKEALRAELEKPNFSESTAKSLQAQVKAAHDKLADHRLQGILEVKKILTPEQFAKFQEKTKERHDNRMERRKEHREDRQEKRKEWREKHGGKDGPMKGQGPRGSKSEGDDKDY